MQSHLTERAASVNVSAMEPPTRQYAVIRAGEPEPAGAGPPDGRAEGLRRTVLVGRHVGAVHTGVALAAFAPEARVDEHLHSTEQSFYVLEGNPRLTVEGRTYSLAPNECGLLPVGVPHAWRGAEKGEALVLEVNCPAPRDTFPPAHPLRPPAQPPDTFWTGVRAPEDRGERPDIRDPRTRAFFRLGTTDMDLDSRKLGAPVDAPSVSASMATALLAYSGIAVKMLIDQRLGAVLHTMFMVEYQPGGVAQPHDHPLEEMYYMLEGEVEAEADGEVFTLGPGDAFWTGVGCIHAFRHRGSGRVRWLETQSPQPPANYSYRFNRDWDYLAAALERAGSEVGT